MFSTLLNTNFNFWFKFILSFTTAFNFNYSKMLSFGKGLSNIAAVIGSINPFLNFILPVLCTISFPSNWLLSNITIIETVSSGERGIHPVTRLSSIVGKKLTELGIEQGTSCAKPLHEIRGISQNFVVKEQLIQMFVCLGFYAISKVFQLFNSDSSQIHVTRTIFDQYFTSPLS